MSQSLLQSAAGGGWGANAQLALDTLAMKPTRGIPHWVIHVMEIPQIEHFAGCSPGDYDRDPAGVYLAFQRNIETAFIDQWIPTNPQTMTAKGFDHRRERSATTGAEQTVLDGITIDSPEAVLEHMERFVWPDLRRKIAEFDPNDPARLDDMINGELDVQRLFGPDMLKVPYGRPFATFPGFRYGLYGYAAYFMAYALYPQVMARDFSLQADLATRINTAGANAIRKAGLPAVLRLDHDMADSRGTLVRIETLDELWFPHFVRCIRPFLDAGVRLLWHCDGNLMAMVPRLIEAGVSGFQGFQYEDGMDYERICRMTDRDGNPLMIWAGVSVTRTLPMGTPQDVADELKRLVRHGPPVGLVLGGSSSVAPGVKRENLAKLFEGLRHYQKCGRE